MSYMIDKWNTNQVHISTDGAIGWLMNDGEFRPLMADAVEELKAAGLIDTATVLRTEVARKLYVEQTLAAYSVAQKNRTAEQIAEERFEARAAMGVGVSMVNILTGEKFTT